jgi:putative Holliday junction resolvase
LFLMRWVGVDVGKKRVGLALSDASATLARPWETIGAGASVAATAGGIGGPGVGFERDALEEHAFAGIVVGLPRRLGGEETDQTGTARALADALAVRKGLIVHMQDERLTSHEAESRLAERERDWRARKRQIDAVAAAIILQDFLDTRQAAGQG